MGSRAQTAVAGEGPIVQRSGWSTFEPLMAIILAGAVWVGMFQFGGATDVISRPLWLDEALTYRLVIDPDVGHMMRALAGGCDTHPPMYYWVLRAVAAATVGPDRVVLRAVSIACVVGAAAVFYLAMRRATGRLGAAAGAIAILVHPVVVAQSVELRMYAPMLLCAVVLAALVGAEGMSRWRWVGIALASSALCSVHYFGIVAWGLILVGRWLWRRDGLGWLWPALAGPVALAAGAAVLIGQWRAAGGASWMPPLSARAAGEFLRQMIPWALAVVIAGLIAIWLWRRPRDGTGARAVVGAYLGLLGMPVVLLAISVAVQPAYVGRYAIVFAAGLGAAVAVLVRRAGRAAGVVACAAMLAWGTWQTEWWAVVPRSAYFRALRIGEAIESEPDTPVVLASLDDEETLRYMYSVPGHAVQLRFLVAPEVIAGRTYAYNCRMAANLARYYPAVTLLSLPQAERLGRFIYVPVGDADAPARVFPTFSAAPANEFTFVMQPR